MPLISIGLLQQEQSGQSSTLTYVSPPNIARNWFYQEMFSRTTVNPTGAFTLYATVATNSGTATVVNQQQLSLVTDTAISDDVNVRTSELALSRVNRFISSRTALELDVIFQLAQTADTEVYIGLDSAAGITALPTTTRHFGFELDRSASANFFFNAGNGSAQTTDTDSGFAADTDVNRFNAVWSADNTIVMRLFNGDPPTTEQASVTVTDIGGSVDISMPVHFFVQTEATAAKTLRIYEWKIGMA